MSSEYIFVVSGYAAGSRIAVDDDLLIGRAAENAGRLGGDPELSRRHARITWDSGRLVIEDLGSSNGTFVNDARLDGPHSLQAGDVVKVGHTTLEVRSGARTNGPLRAALNRSHPFPRRLTSRAPRFGRRSSRPAPRRPFEALCRRPRARLRRPRYSMPSAGSWSRRVG